jgi:hypothetical protein
LQKGRIGADKTSCAPGDGCAPDGDDAVAVVVGRAKIFFVAAARPSFHLGASRQRQAIRVAGRWIPVGCAHLPAPRLWNRDDLPFVVA